uniref:Transport permease protein n=1 Tax=Candidatus Kentrum sp. SD TaxID=2126332 RepID=A0A450YD80_9GAMM|nr:MAG: lipopolysaccharide transport system permease protein [Candidatus Kentron sp. SD]VFK44523.1 MAG: lipopolysaccharide transport system permease protein [Candidatus Kentron sp. SD]
MSKALVFLVKNRNLIKATVFQAMRTRMVGNTLGLAWLALYPLLFLGMYASVFVVLLGVRMPGVGTIDYVLAIFCGLVPFLAFAEAFGTGTVSIVANRGLLRNTLFPIELVVARDVIVGHVSMAIGFVIVWIFAIYQGHFYWTHLLVPIIFVFQIVMVLGIVWITSSLTVFFRDLQQATPILVLFLMLVSPIAYVDSMVPEQMKPILLFNPLAWLMGLYRACLLEGEFPPIDFLVFATFSLVALMMGYRLVSRLKPLFSDYV